MSTPLRRIVLLIPDLSTLGGIQLRTAKTLRHSSSRSCDYVCISLKWEKPGDHVNDIAAKYMVYLRERERILVSLRQWSPADTVIVFPNNTLRNIDPDLRNALDRFPLVFVGAGQLSYLLQDSEALADGAYCEALKVTKIVVLSNIDSMMYSQFGIHDTIVGFNPVETRPVNTYSSSNNKYIGYVGRLDFRTKGCDRLIDICRAVRDTGRGPLYVYTVSNPRNSPDLKTFRELVKDNGLTRDVKFVFDQIKLDTLYSTLQLLVMPSRKESFGNSILEANSYGVPVLSSSYAPGPATLIEHNRTGILLDKFDYTSVRDALAHLTPERISALSAAAFEKHHTYSMTHYFDHLEAVGADALACFTGVNQSNVLPTLRPVEWFRRQNDTLMRRQRAMRALHTWIKDSIPVRALRFLALRLRPWTNAKVRRRIYQVLTGQPKSPVSLPDKPDSALRPIAPSPLQTQ